MSPIRTIKIALPLLAIGLFLACDEDRETITDNRNVSLGEAKSAQVELRMGAGEVRLQGGSRDLMDAEFRYNRERMKPEVDYSVRGERGYLTVKQGRRHRFFVGNIKNEWDVRLKDGLPMDLKIKLGAGEGRLDLEGLDVGKLDIDMGVGEMRLSLLGPRQRDLDIMIDGGVGSGTIILPRDIGVRAEVDGGIGSVNAHGLSKSRGFYTNEAYGKTDINIRIRVSAGIGSIDLRLGGEDI